MADLTSDPLWPTHLPTSDIIRCSLTNIPTYLKISRHMWMLPKYTPLCATQCMKKCHVKMMKKVIDVILDWYQTQNNNLYWPSMLFFGEQPLWFWVHIIEGHYLFGFGYEIKEKYSFRGCPFHLSRKMLLYPTGIPEAENPFTFFAPKSKWNCLIRINNLWVLIDSFI